MGAKLQALLAKAKQQWADIWDKEKGIIFLVAALAIFLKFRDIIIGILIGSANRVDKDAKKKDDQLASQENQLKQQADQAVQDAANEPQKETPVTDDWNKEGN